MTTTADKTNTVLTAIQNYISRYVQMGEDELLTVALWVLHTWTFSESVPNPYTTPYLYIHSAERRSGKTRLLEVLATIVRNPLLSADVTPAVVFRSIEANCPTLMIDEVDAIWSGAKNEDLRGVLNSGYKKSGSVLRIEGKEATSFKTFGPKALSGIDNNMLPDTVRDRCIPIHMHRQATDKAEPFYSWLVEEQTEELLNMIVEWLEEVYPKIAREMPKMIEEISDRAQEITMPLLIIAHSFTGVIAGARKALTRLLTVEETLSPNEQLLSDIRDIFTESGSHVLPGHYIMDKLSGDWNGKLLASRLKPFGIQPTTVRFQNKVDRGYRRDAFEDAWSRHLS